MADAPPGGSHSQWRDPTTTWIAPDATLGNNTYWAAVGAQQDCVGGAALYASADFLAWEYRGVLFSQHSLGDASCVPQVGGGQCDQFSGCPMNECPDYFTLSDGEGSVSIIKYSDQVCVCVVGVVCVWMVCMCFGVCSVITLLIYFTIPSTTTQSPQQQHNPLCNNTTIPSAITPQSPLQHHNPLYNNNTIPSAITPQSPLQ